MLNKVIFLVKRMENDDILQLNDSIVLELYSQYKILYQYPYSSNL